MCCYLCMWNCAARYKLPLSQGMSTGHRRLTAIMTSVFLCAVHWRERDVAWVRINYRARELCIITSVSRDGAWYRNAFTDVLMPGECTFLRIQIGFDMHIRGFRHIGTGSDGWNRPWCKAWSALRGRGKVTFYAHDSPQKWNKECPFQATIEIMSSLTIEIPGSRLVPSDTSYCKKILIYLIFNNYYHWSA